MYAATFPKYEPLARLVETRDGPALRWDLQRNCLFSPRQTVATLAVVAGLGAYGAMMAWLTGRPGLSACFIATDALAVALFLLYVLHACDRESVMLIGHRLEIECLSGGRLKRDAFDIEWVRVDYDEHTEGLVRLAQRQCAISIGRHLSPPTRSRVAGEIRRALAFRRSRPLW